MGLIERSETMPAPKPGWQVFARTRAGDVIALKTPKLSLGERLLGKYGPFWQVDTRPQQSDRTLQVRSKTGRLAFQVAIRLTYALRADGVERLVDSADPVAQFLMPTVETEARSVARRYTIQDYDLFSDALNEALDPRRSVLWRDGPVDLLGVLVEADMPADMVSVDEQMAMLEGLDGRVALAELKGETAAAQRMRNAADAMREFVRRRADDLSFKADEIIEMRRKINAMVDLGEDEDNPIVRSILAQVTEMARRTTDGTAGSRDGDDTERLARNPGHALSNNPEDAD